MKNILWICLIVLFVQGCHSQQEVALRCATFNMRYDNPADSLNGWPYRKDRVAQLIQEERLDVVGTQELLHHQFEQLKELLPGYDGVGVARDDGKQDGEYSAIFYRKEQFDCLESNTFWLSETPEVPSRGWNAACVRIATWAKLREKTSGKILMVVNTHFDHVSEEARKQSALLIIRKIQEIVGELPAMVMGDLNVTDESEAYRTLTTQKFVLRDAHKIAETKKGVDYTYHSFARIPKESCPKIDFVFVTPHFQVVESEVVEENPKALLSDHNPQIVQLKL